MESYIGKTLGDFEIVRELGRGGQGFVFLARQMPLKRDVALKVIPVLASVSSSHVKRFIREAEATAKLKHPNIIEVYQIGQEAEHYFYAMELVDGWSLDKIIGGMKDYTLREQEAVSEAEAAAEPETLLEDDQFHLKEPDVILQVAASGGTKEGDYGQDDVSQASTAREDGAQADNLQLDPRQYERLPSEYYRWAANIIEQAANALEHAHQNGIIHRDIKPSNIMVSREEVVKITDFGLARDVGEKTMTITGKPMGTPAYMSPEQIRARLTPIDKRTDIYSLGVTLYEAISLDRPFRGQTTQELYHNISVKEPRDPRRTNPNAPRDLAVIALKAVEKDPDRRYQSAKEMADDLDRYRSKVPILAKPPRLVNKVIKFVKRNKAPMSIPSLFAVLFIVVLGAVYMKSQRDRALKAEKEVQDVLEPEDTSVQLSVRRKAKRLYTFAKVCFECGDYDAAVSKLQEFIEQFPGSEDRAEVEKMLLNAKVKKEAEDLLKQEDSRVQLSVHRQETSKMPPEQRRKNATHFYRAAKALFESEDYDTAAAKLQEFAEQFPDSEHIEEVQTMLRKAKVKLASPRKYEEVAEKLYNRGKTALDRGAYEWAIERFRRVTVKYAESAVFSEAEERLKEAKTEHAEKLYSAGEAAYREERYSDAIDPFQKLVQRYPNSDYFSQAKSCLENLSRTFLVRIASDAWVVYGEHKLLKQAGWVCHTGRKLEEIIDDDKEWSLSKVIIGARAGIRLSKDGVSLKFIEREGAEDKTKFYLSERAKQQKGDKVWAEVERLSAEQAKERPFIKFGNRCFTPTGLLEYQVVVLSVKVFFAVRRYDFFDRELAQFHGELWRKVSQQLHPDTDRREAIGIQGVGVVHALDDFRYEVDSFQPGSDKVGEENRWVAAKATVVVSYNLKMPVYKVERIGTGKKQYVRNGVEEKIVQKRYICLLIQKRKAIRRFLKSKKNAGELILDRGIYKIPLPNPGRLYQQSLFFESRMYGFVIAIIYEPEFDKVFQELRGHMGVSGDSKEDER